MSYAHSKPDCPPERWHRLEQHLRDTAKKAREFAAPWGAGDWAYWAGMWHDLGKFSAEFQARLDPDAHLETQPGRVDHSTAGAIHAHKTLGPPAALAIAGHHAGLADWVSLHAGRLKKQQLLDAALLGGAKNFQLQPAPKPSSPAFLAGNCAKVDKQRALELWTRFLFSALVDADRLDTEAFCEPDKPREREHGIGLRELAEMLDRHLDTFNANSPVNLVRREILEACRRAAELPPGCFSLTAPTGAGKTLSAMAFALRHAVKQELRRVIVVLPYTSIIEQSANVYREVLGADGVVEHHSNLDPARETRFNHLASENWDAPVIVTTTVQFFESLFANKPSACRKLHNIARSVVILDEAQALPAELLAPVLDVLRALVRDYGVSLVISTATQPAFRQREGFTGLEQIREIVPQRARAFAQLRRVRIHWPARLDQPASWEEIAAELQKHPCVLAIVHRRQDARELTQLLPHDTIHLSAAMCAAHRLAVIRRIKSDLEANKPIRVISTQLVEAGVDIDFPVVYRALAGLDAVAQSAGRCNREGKLAEGHCHLFVAPTQPPPGILRKALEQTRTMLAESGDQLDPLSPEPFERFFRGLYFRTNLDAKGIQALREGLNFEQVAAAFQMIEEGGMTPVVVPYGDAPRRLDELRFAGPSRERLRALQPFIVSLWQHELREIQADLQPVADTVWALHPCRYDQRFGVVTGPLFRDPATLTV